MSKQEEKINKTSLQEAKDNYNELKEFAKKVAMEELTKQIDEKINTLINENIVVDVDTNTGEVEIEKDGQKIEIEDSKKEIDEYIQITEDMKTEQEENVQQAVPAVPVDATQAPMDAGQAPEIENPEANEEQPGEEITPDVTQMIQAIYDKLIGTGEEGEAVQIIDDQPGAEGAPQDANVAPQPDATAAPIPEQPIQEENIVYEINDIDVEELSRIDIPTDSPENEKIPYKPEIEKPMEEIQVVDEINLDELSENEVLEIVDEDMEEENLNPVEEVHGHSTALQHGSRLGILPGEGANYREKINENKKAQNESKLDELKKENEGLKQNLNEMKTKIKEYNESFVDIRKQFNEMQVINAKLVYLNKLYANGGFKNTEKSQLSEQFDKVKTADEAEKLYSKILQENNLIVSNKENVENKLKIQKTNAAPTSKTGSLYENDEIRRMKQIAGIIKIEEE